MTTQGRRIYADSQGFLPASLSPGDYAYSPVLEAWLVCAPNGAEGRIDSVSVHTVTEYPDGTITLSPSLVYTAEKHGRAWHGFLERGEFREV